MLALHLHLLLGAGGVERLRLLQCLGGAALGLRPDVCCCSGLVARAAQLRLPRVQGGLEGLDLAARRAPATLTTLTTLTALTRPSPLDQHVLLLQRGDVRGLHGRPHLAGVGKQRHGLAGRAPRVLLQLGGDGRPLRLGVGRALLGLQVAGAQRHLRLGLHPRVLQGAGFLLEAAALGLGLEALVPRRHHGRLLLGQLRLQLQLGLAWQCSSCRSHSRSSASCWLLPPRMVGTYSCVSSMGRESAL